MCCIGVPIVAILHFCIAIAAIYRVFLHFLQILLDTPILLFYNAVVTDIPAVFAPAAPPGKAPNAPNRDRRTVEDSKRGCQKRGNDGENRPEKRTGRG
jgi:hypothetical protein